MVTVIWPAEDATSFARANLLTSPATSTNKRLKLVGSVGSLMEKKMVAGWPTVRGPAGVSRTKLAASGARLRKEATHIDLGYGCQISSET